MPTYLPYRVAAVLLGCSVASVSSVSSASTVAFDFDTVTQLARGAIDGVNVESAVPGFELRLLHQGKVVYDQSFGLFANGRVVNADSSTKTLSGALIMSLTDSSPQPFSLDTRLSTYLPTFGGEKSTITVRQAFSHSSGLGDSNVIGNENLTLQQAAALIGLNTPVSYGPPGTQFSYGGASMHAAGAAAEIAGGASWNELFAARITGPLGMTSTSFALTTPTHPRIAGGVETNAADFGRFMDMLLNDGVDRATGTRVLSSTAVAQMLARQVADDITVVNTPADFDTDFANSDYGIGIWFEQRDTNGDITRPLAAGARGFSSWIELEEDLVGVFATDLTSGSNIAGVRQMMADAVKAALHNPRLVGDADRDADVDFDDLLRLAANYERPRKLWSEGDFDGNGIVNFDDLLGLASNYGATSSAAFHADFAIAQSLVPEPSSAGIVGITLATVGASRRRRRGESAHAKMG